MADFCLKFRVMTAAHEQERAAGASDALSTALAAAGLDLAPARLADFLAGVAAAPRPEDPAAWLPLVYGLAGAPAETPDPALAEALIAARDALAANLWDPLTDRSDRAPRLAALRAELAARGLAGFLVPLADAHQGEYLPARDQRLAWLTGFTGSAGIAVVLAEEAAVFVDGRYVLQARDQVDPDLFDFGHLTDSPPKDWIAAHLPAGGALGFDPWLHTPKAVETLRAACEKAGGSLVACETNPVDAVWPDQPPAPLAPVVAHGDAVAGEGAAAKRARIAADLAEAGADAAVLTAPDSIAWLLNVRGGDLPHNPVPLSFAILHADAGGPVDWFIDSRKLMPGLETHLGAGVRVQAPDKLGPALDKLGQAGRQIRLDTGGAAAWLRERLLAAGAGVMAGADPCALPKARKNAAELAGARAAHRRDGAALCRFLAWLAREAPGGAVTEIAAADRLYAFRRESPAFRDLSFPTISGAGPNGAIVHYRVTPETDRALAPGALYLVDSGAQYPDGTTDVTRTVFVAGAGAPDEDAVAAFTAVLRGHIALARLRFPKGTAGAQIDALARAPLWALGRDFDHGTGHGVGSYLSVHEGPQRISKRGGDVALEPGMILSNEPGYYETGAFGIRIENLLAVHAEDRPDGAEGPAMLAFETLTLAPVDRALIDPAQMTAAETAWLDAYHARVLAEIGPLVDPDTAAWLAAACAPL